MEKYIDYGDYYTAGYFYDKHPGLPPEIYEILTKRMNTKIEQYINDNKTIDIPDAELKWNEMERID